jgi:hypothetical protein
MIRWILGNLMHVEFTKIFIPGIRFHPSHWFTKDFHGRSCSVLSRARISCIFPIILLAGCCALLCAQHPANANATYQKLRGLLPGDDVIAVNNLELRRNAGVFTFSHGNFAFYGEVNGKVTGAVFKGEGHFHLTPPTAQERHNLAILNKSEEFDEDFNLAVLRFTDATADKLRKAAAGKSGPDAAYGKAAEELQSFLHHNSAASHMNPWGIFYYRKIEGNLDLRLLEDVLSPAPGGFFYASMHGNKSPHFIFQLDPLGVAGLAPEEVSLQIWDRSNESMTYPLAFHSTAEYANGNKHNAAYTIASENLDVTIEGSGFLSCVATVEVRAEQDSVAVIPLDLYPTLRVSNVETDKGAALDYVQEKKDEDADFGVVLAQPLKKGESTAIRIAYSGKDVVMNEGNEAKLVSKWIQRIWQLCQLSYVLSCAQGVAANCNGNQGERKYRRQDYNDRVEDRGAVAGGGLQPWQVRHERGKGGKQAGRQPDHRRLCQHKSSRYVFSNERLVQTSEAGW